MEMTEKLEMTMTCETSPTWLPKEDQNKDDANSPAIVDGGGERQGKVMGHQPCTKNYRQPKNAESGRNSFP